MYSSSSSSSLERTDLFGLASHVSTPAVINIHRSSPDNTSSSAAGVCSAPHHLDVYYQNINGMRTKLLDFKLSVIENDFDVIGIVESRLFPGIPSSEFFCELKFNVFRRVRCTAVNQKGGGVFLAVDSRFQSAPVNLIHQDIEQICVILMPSAVLNCKLYICLSYIPPCSSFEVYKKHVRNVDDISTRCCGDDDSYLLIFGDFNLPSIGWELDPDDLLLVPFNVSSSIEKLVIDSFLSNNLLHINNI